MTFTMTLPRSFRSKVGALISPSGGNVVAWFYPAQVSRAESFPQPFSRNRDRELRISNVPLGATVIMSTHDGIERARIDGTDPTGGARWQLRLADGSLLLDRRRLSLPHSTYGWHRTSRAKISRDSIG